MESKNLFRSFKYVVGNNFIYNDKVKVKVFFLYGYKSVVLSLYIKKKEKASESYYLTEAKKIINQKIKNGSLKAESEQYVKNAKKKKVLSYGVLAVGIVALATGAAVGSYFAMNSHPVESTDPWYEREDWWNYCSNGIKGIQASKDDIGKEVTLQVNGLEQKVRLIDIDKDVDSEGNKIHTTFEFGNLLSDENGYSLATYWQNTNSVDSANYDYTNSTIRAVLNGHDYEGASRADINWFQYFGSKEDKEKTGKNRLFSVDYSNKSVVSMLPKGLVDALKSPSKYVNIFANDKYEEITVNDKLFLLSPREIGFSEDDIYGQEASTTSYKFYESHTDYMDDFRIKKQIKGSNGARTSILYGKDLDGAYKPPLDIRQPGNKSSYAGYNATYKNTSGGSYWLRSPYYAGPGYNPPPGWNPDCWFGSAWYVDDIFGMADGFCIYAYDRAMGIAPAFCI